MADESASARNRARKRKRAGKRLGTALIGVPGLVGGVVTGTVTYVTTMRQINSAATESRVEFYRKEKQALCTQFLKDSTAVEEPIEHFAHDFAAVDYPNSADIDNLRNAVPLVLEKVRDDYYAIRILGGAAANSANDVYRALLAEYNVTDGLYDKMKRGELSDDDRRSSYGVPDSPLERASSAAADNFAAAASRDLESTR